LFLHDAACVWVEVCADARIYPRIEKIIDIYK
jgi:hypothetical protein